MHFQIYKKNWRWIAGVVTLLVIAHVWLHLTNPYAAINIVQQPYITRVQDGQIIAEKQFSLHALSGPLASVLGYYKSGFLIVQNTFFGSKPTRATETPAILAEIHQKRFDPSKPYLISGDQFSVLYTRNLGVFYNDLLNPYTALNQTDWENRQRIYLQSALFALDAFSAADDLTTTLVPIGPRTVLLTQVHPGSLPSDTLYGLLYALAALQNEGRYPNGPYKLQTATATRQIIAARQGDIRRLLDVYLRQVQDPHTKLIKRDVVLSGARDGIHRESSFFDNVILWRTLGLAKELGASAITGDELTSMRQKIIQTYWDETEGHFADDLQHRPAKANYSSDWLIALPAGFLSPNDTADLAYLEKSIAFMREQGVTQPLPVKYTAAAAPDKTPWAIKHFVPNYGGNSIWSYWGAEYLTLLANLYHTTGNSHYRQEAERGIAAYNQKIEAYRGFPETFTPDGQFLSNTFYKSIRQTGWAVQFETAMQALDPDEYVANFIPRANQPIMLTGSKQTCTIWLCDLQ